MVLMASACGGSHVQGPNADPAGLFPRHYRAKAFIDPGSTLVSATAATAATRTYTFDVDVPYAFAIVANCTGGQITVSGADGGSGGPGPWWRRRGDRDLRW